MFLYSIDELTLDIILNNFELCDIKSLVNLHNVLLYDKNYNAYFIKLIQNKLNEFDDIFKIPLVSDNCTHYDYKDKLKNVSNIYKRQNIETQKYILNHLVRRMSCYLISQNISRCQYNLLTHDYKLSFFKLFKYYPTDILSSFTNIFNEIESYDDDDIKWGSKMDLIFGLFIVTVIKTTYNNIDKYNIVIKFLKKRRDFYLQYLCLYIDKHPKSEQSLQVYNQLQNEYIDEYNKIVMYC